MGSHALLSASSSKRWIECPPSARMCEQYEDKGSDYAAEGTEAHALCEYLLKTALGMGAYFINANSATAPGIVDADRNPILSRSEVYSGVYGRASITLYAFNSNGNKGIACGLNNLQKFRDGEPLGGRASAESDFADEGDDDFLR